MSEPVTVPELCYRLHRGTLSDPCTIPHWDELEPWVREAITFCIQAALAGTKDERERTRRKAIEDCIQEIDLMGGDNAEWHANGLKSRLLDKQ